MDCKLRPKYEVMAPFEVRIWTIEVLETTFSSNFVFSNVLEARNSNLWQELAILRHIFYLKEKRAKKVTFQKRQFFHTRNMAVQVKQKNYLQENYFLIWKNIVLAIHNGSTFDFWVSGWGNTAVFVKYPLFWKQVRTPGSNTRKWAYSKG